MSQTREYEYILLKNLSDSDDEESVQEQPKREPINTLAIIRKLQRQEQLEEVNQRLSWINKWEKAKYALPGSSAAAFGIASLGGYAGWLAYFFTRPTYKQVVFAKNALIYANTTIQSLNKTCGALFPLSSSVCDNPFKSLNATHCSYLFDVALTDLDKITNLNESISQSLIKPAVSMFDTLCGIPNLLGYCHETFNRHFYDGRLNYLYHYAYDCFFYAQNIQSENNFSMCNSSWTSLYSESSSFLYRDTNTLDKTCGDLFPVDMCTDFDGYFHKILNCIDSMDKECDVTARFSKMVAGYNESTGANTFQTFYDTLNETLIQYNQTLIKYQHILSEYPNKLLQLTQEYQQYQQAIATLNQPMSGVNYSCTERYVNFDALHTCEYAASTVCEYHGIDYRYPYRDFSSNMEKMPNHIHGWTDLGIIILAIPSVIMLGILIGTIVTIIFGTSWLNQRTIVDDLSEEDRKELDEIFEICELHHGERINEMKIETASKFLEKCVASLSDDKKMLLDMNSILLAGINDPGSPFSSLPPELINNILYRIGLLNQPPMDNDQISNRRFAFLMGRADPKSTIPPNLSNEIAHKIFHHAGIPARPLASSTYVVPNLTYETNRHTRNNCFTFFLGRDDESSYIDERTPMNIFQKIYSHTGLFRQLSIGKYEVESNEKLSIIELQKSKKAKYKYSPGYSFGT